MRRRDLRRVRAVAALAAISALALAGAGTPKKKRAEPPPPKVEETIADLAYIASAADTKLEGVGLVVGLDDTGADAPPSPYRTKLVDDMRKAGVEKPNDFLKSTKVSLVIVRMVVRSGVAASDRLDVDIELPPGSGTKSLAGGYLLQTRLRETMVLGGVPREGPDAAFAQGPVMTGNAAKPEDPKVGRVLGGGRLRKEIPHQLVLKENRKSFRTSALVEAVINQRFPQTEGVEQKGSATAKTDQFLVLRVPRIYHQNEDRFFKVVKLLPVVDTVPLRTQRLAAWGKDLLDPSKAGLAALRLEGLGVTATDTLKAALSNPNGQVRFFAAQALAYLNDPDGAEVLAQTVKTLPEFRAHALAALASTDQAAFHMKLRKLMDEPETEVRYGAFNALRTLAPDDYALGRVRVLDEPPGAEEEQTPPDSMAAAITQVRNRKHVEDPFALYVVDCEGPPMVHVSRTRRCEVVVFGRGAKLLTPVVLGSGPFLLNASDGDESVEVSRIVASRADADAKVISSLELGDVLRRAAGIGASYPDLVNILQAAQKQQNLPGPLVVDAVPVSRVEYLQAEVLGKDATVKKDDAVKTTKGEAEPASKARRWNLLDRFRRR